MAKTSRRPKFVTFDAAQTLIRVRWNPATVLLGSLVACKVQCDTQIATETYMRLLQTRWPEYKRRNLTRDADLVDQWWHELTQAWLASMGLPDHLAQPLAQAAERLLYGPDAQVFTLYEDSLTCLREVSDAGIPCGILSNWDMSLHRVTQHLGLRDHVQFVLCSDEEGYQKPDKEFFEIAASAAGVDPADILHVGDNPVDDVQGALGAGFQALHLDRDGKPGPMRVTTLNDVLIFLK